MGEAEYETQGVLLGCLCGAVLGDRQAGDPCLDDVSRFEMWRQRSEISLTMLLASTWSWEPLVTAASEPLRSRCCGPSNGEAPLTDIGEPPSKPCAGAV